MYSSRVRPRDNIHLITRNAEYMKIRANCELFQCTEVPKSCTHIEYEITRPYFYPFVIWSDRNRLTYGFNLYFPKATLT